MKLNMLYVLRYHPAFRAILPKVLIPFARKWLVSYLDSAALLFGTGIEYADKRPLVPCVGVSDLFHNFTTILLYLSIKQKHPFRDAVCLYRFDHCGALRAFLRPNFRRSFERGSRFKKPSCLRVVLSDSSSFTSTREIPWRTASA